MSWYQTLRQLEVHFCISCYCIMCIEYVWETADVTEVIIVVIFFNLYQVRDWNSSSLKLFYLNFNRKWLKQKKFLKKKKKSTSYLTIISLYIWYYIHQIHLLQSEATHHGSLKHKIEFFWVSEKSKFHINFIHVFGMQTFNRFVWFLIHTN